MKGSQIDFVDALRAGASRSRTRTSSPRAAAARRSRRRTTSRATRLRTPTAAAPSAATNSVSQQRNCPYLRTGALSHRSSPLRAAGRVGCANPSGSSGRVEADFANVESGLVRILVEGDCPCSRRWRICCFRRALALAALRLRSGVQRARDRSCSDRACGSSPAGRSPSSGGRRRGFLAAAGRLLRGTGRQSSSARTSCWVGS